MTFFRSSHDENLRVDRPPMLGWQMTPVRKHSHPFAHTNSYFYSFVPHTITLWNNLNPTTVTAPSLATFRNSLNYPLSL